MYSAARHYFSLFGDRNPIMAEFTVFFDDSGTHKESNIAVAACFISDRRRWEKFDEEWQQAAQDPEDGFGTFHMADFVARKGPFEGWSSDKADRVIRKVLNIIGNRTLAGFASAVIKSDYDAVITGKLREKLGRHHYTFAVQSCLAYLEEWFKREMLQPYEPVEYVFDRMSQGKHEILDLFDSLLKCGQARDFGIEVGGFSFQDKTKFLPLQVADIVAWESYRYMRDVQRDPTGSSVPRKSFESMVKSPGVRGRFFAEKHLRDVAQVMTASYERVGWDSSPLGGFVSE